jgi:hypothetical protein
MRRKAGGLYLVKRFIDVAQAGSMHGSAGISPIKVVGDDGFVVEQTSGTMGYLWSLLDFYVFRQGRVVHLVPTVRLSADNSGAKEDSTSVEGSWTMGRPAKNGLSIEYKVVTKSRTSISRAVWEIRGDELRLKSGVIPPELEEAAGGG